MLPEAVPIIPLEDVMPLTVFKLIIPVVDLITPLSTNALDVAVKT